jgi:hypothetical protein
MAKFKIKNNFFYTHFDFDFCADFFSSAKGLKVIVSCLFLNHIINFSLKIKREKGKMRRNFFPLAAEHSDSKIAYKNV